MYLFLEMRHYELIIAGNMVQRVFWISLNRNYHHLIFYIALFVDCFLLVECKSMRNSLYFPSVVSRKPRGVPSIVRTCLIFTISTFPS